MSSFCFMIMRSLWHFKGHSNNTWTLFRKITLSVITLSGFQPMSICLFQSKHVEEPELRIQPFLRRWRKWPWPQWGRVWRPPAPIGPSPLGRYQDLKKRQFHWDLTWLNSINSIKAVMIMLDHRNVFKGQHLNTSR